MKIFVIGGKARSGKSTFGDYLRDELKQYGYKPCVMHITEPLYTYARNYFDWDETRDGKPREFLQNMGIQIIKEKLHKETFLLDRISEDIEILSEFFDCFIITDARLKNEFEYFKNKYENVSLIRLDRENYDDELSEEERNHVTETSIDLFNQFDYVISNKSFDDLKETAHELAKNEASSDEEGLI